MNFSMPTGILLAAVAIAYLGKTGIKNPEVLFSMHAAVIVFGGTIAAALVCFPFRHFLNLFMIFFRTLSGKLKAETFRTINEIVKISEALNQGHAIETQLKAVKNSFLKEGLELMHEGGLSDDELDEILEKRVEYQNERYKRDSMTFKIIGKFPPAFGLIGTSLGMIALLQGLGNKDAFEQLGPSMSIALVATLYGLILANVILIPLGENLAQASEEDLVMRRIVVDGVRLLKEKKHPILVREYLKCYLTPAERTKMKRATG